jgi:ligand-binding sensor domain-containing protein
MEGGLSHWDKQHLTNYLIKPERINSIIEDRNGTVWFVRSRLSDAAEGGLCQVIGTGMRCYGKADGIPGSDGMDTLVEDTLGNLWISNDTAVVRWKPGSFSTFVLEKLKSKEGISSAKGLAVNPDGSVWVGVDLPGRGLTQIGCASQSSCAPQMYLLPFCRWQIMSYRSSALYRRSGMFSKIGVG